MFWALTFWDRPGTIFKWKLCLSHVVELSIKSSFTPPPPPLAKSDPCLAASLPLTHVCLPTCLVLQCRTKTSFYHPGPLNAVVFDVLERKTSVLWLGVVEEIKNCDDSGILGSILTFEPQRLFCGTLLLLCYLIPVFFLSTSQARAFLLGLIYPLPECSHQWMPLSSSSWSTTLPLFSTSYGREVMSWPCSQT